MTSSSMRTFSVSKAAKELGVSAGTVYGLCAARRIRHERIGLGRGTIRIPEDSIEEYRKTVTVAAEGPGQADSPLTPLKPKRLAGAKPQVSVFRFLPPA